MQVVYGMMVLSGITLELLGAVNHPRAFFKHALTWTGTYSVLKNYICKGMHKL